MRLIRATRSLDNRPPWPEPKSQNQNPIFGITPQRGKNREIPLFSLPEKIFVVCLGSAYNNL